MNTHYAEPSLLPRNDRMTPWCDTLAKLCFGISNPTSLKKKKFKVKMLVTIFLKQGRFLSWITLKKKSNFRACNVLIALQSVSGNSNFNMQQ